MIIFLRIFVTILASTTIATTAAQAARRHALVVGINKYDNLPREQQLDRAVNDVQALSEALIKLGFDVVKLENASRSEFNRAWQSFLNRITKEDTAAIFFSGHGVEVGGLNYLLPRDIPAIRGGEAELLRRESLGVADLLSDLRDRNPQVSLLVLDACRDNPFKEAGRRSVGGTRGLADVQPPEGSFVMFSAAAGEIALDRLSDSDPVPTSVYTRHLLPLLSKPGLALPEIAQQVRREVRETAARVNHKQTPAYRDEVLGRFCLAGCESQVAVGPKLDEDGLGRPEPRPEVTVVASARAIAIDPMDAEAYYKRAKALLAKKDYDAAIADFTKVLSIDHSHTRALAGRGMAYREKLDLDKAIEDFTQAIKMDPHDVRLLNSRGIIYGVKNDTDKAIADYTEAIRIDPKYSFAYHNRCRINYLTRRDFDQAIKDCSEAMRLSPRYVSAINYRGLAFVAKGSLDKAGADFDAALAIEPGYKYALNNRGFLWLRKGDRDRALADFEAALQGDPRQVTALTGRAQVRFQKGEYDKAFADLDAALSIDPANVQALRARAGARIERGEPSKAIPDLTEVIRLDPGNAVAYNDRAWAYFKMGDGSKGLPDVEKAIGLAPKLAAAYDTRAQIHEQMGQTDKAVTDYRRALDLRPDLSASREGLKRLGISK